MEIKNCVRCRKLFVPLNKNSEQKLCVECRELEQKEFLTLKNYLKENPSSGLKDISKATGVEEDRIIYYLKEGKLEITSENCILSCEACFAPIKSGRYCKECSAQLSKSISSIYQAKDDEKAVASMLTKIQLRNKK